MIIRDKWRDRGKRAWIALFKEEEGLDLEGMVADFGKIGWDADVTIAGAYPTLHLHVGDPVTALDDMKRAVDRSTQKGKRPERLMARIICRLARALESVLNPSIDASDPRNRRT